MEKIKSGKYTIYKDGKIWSDYKKGYLRLHTTKAGYVTCSFNSKVTTLHRIIAKFFIDPIEGKNEVNHKDGDKSNNHANNLEWVNRAENQRHAAKKGLLSKGNFGVGKNHTQLRLTDKSIEMIRFLYKNGFTQKEIAELASCTAAYVSMLVNNRYRKM